MQTLKTDGGDVNLLAFGLQLSQIRPLPEVSMYCFFLIVSFLIFNGSVSQAQTSNSATDGENNSDETSHIATNLNGTIKENRASFVLCRIDERVVLEFARAWDKSKHGIILQEALVLIFRMPDDSIKAVPGGHTNEAYGFTFEWNQAIIAIVHTHPNKSNPEPQGRDLLIADRFGVPMFTITVSGMYLYDPATRKTIKVLDGLDWLRPTSWGRYSGLTNNHIASQ